MEDPVEVRSPGGKGVLVVLGVEKAREKASLAQLDDVFLDLGHSSAIEVTVSNSGQTCTFAGSAHVVNCSIASNTERQN